MGRRCQGVAGPGEGMMRREAGARGTMDAAAELEVGGDADVDREDREGRGREENEDEEEEEEAT
jgi:hypothetical protein